MTTSCLRWSNTVFLHIAWNEVRFTIFCDGIVRKLIGVEKIKIQATINN